MPELLDGAQTESIRTILEGSQISVSSCLFWWMDLPQVIERRRLSESFFYIPVKGRIRFEIGDFAGEIGPGELMMVGAETEHAAWMGAGSDQLEVFAIHAHVYTHQAEPLLTCFGEPIGKLDAPEAWFGQLRILTHLMARDVELGARFGASFLRTLLVCQLTQGNLLVKQPQAGDHRIWIAVKWIMDHCASPLTVADLAKRAGLGEVQFRKLFLRQMGRTPKTYIRQIRLSKARALFESAPDMTVKEVAALSGFSDARYLHQVFREEFGISPGGYRNGETQN